MRFAAAALIWFILYLQLYSACVYTYSRSNYIHCVQLQSRWKGLYYVYNNVLSRIIAMYMNIAGIPAEFKHIDKRRRTYNNEYRQSLRMNASYITIEIVDLFIEMLHRMHCQCLGRYVRFAIPSEQG